MARKAKEAVPYSVPQPVYRQRAQVKNLPPPVGGWNRRDPIADMPATDAIVLDNIIPGNGSVQLRNGYSSWVTGIGDYIETLMAYSSPTAQSLFAASTNSIYDVTASGAVGAADVSSLSNGRWQHVNFATAAGYYLVACNGADDVRNYNGTVWSTPTITGVTSADLIGVTAHAQRLFFIQKNTLSAWYLGTQSISGAATELPLGSFCKRGGSLMALGSWSRDGGNGMNDAFVAVTSEGEVVVYEGTDPSDATKWTQVGVFQLAPPLGRRCLIKLGGELGVLTLTGLVPLSRVMAAPLSAQEVGALTDKINGAFREYAQRGSDYFGWQVIEYPRQQLVFVNAPYAERTTQHQFIVNSRTGAWCRFTNMNAGCWQVSNSGLYFGDNSGTVWKYSEDYNDDTDTISAIVQQAFSDFQMPNNKRFLAARPLISAAPGFTPTISLRTDYDTTIPDAAATTTATSLPLWDQALWDVSDWAPSTSPSLAWQSLAGVGKVGSLAMNFTAQQSVEINGMDVMIEPGGFF